MAVLPPLTALRTFEAAARHMSFTKAAEELCVTQSAVSRQIQLLEEFLGLKLFDRTRRAMTLTADGESYRRAISGIFSQIDQATRMLNKGRSKEMLNIQAYTTFTMRWLIPRLKTFQDLHPEIGVRLTASMKPVDFSNTNIHCAIRSGLGDWPYRSDRVCSGYLIPVCTADVAENPVPLRNPEDLLETMLLHSMGRPHDWDRWFAGVGLADFTPKVGHMFESSSMAYQAAHRGLGVAIGQTFLVEDDLKSGALVAPVGRPVRIDETYYFLTSPRYVGTPMVEIFRQWLLEEAAKSSDAFRTASHS